MLPILAGSAITAHRFGTLALATGLALSFTFIGLFIATIGFDIGLDGDLFRTLAAILMLLFAAILLSGTLQDRFAGATAGLGEAAGHWLNRLQPAGLRGQFLIGILLGAVWSPCVGPTLGATAALAAQRQSLGQVAIMMLLFGLGAAIPLLVIGTLSREAMLRWRGRAAGAGKAGKVALGLIMLVIALAILTDLDRRVESLLVDLSPDWLTSLTTHF